MTTTNFADLSLCPEMLTSITEMGFTEATTVQAESIPLIRTGVDILAQSQTGTGKTMAFAIPAVELIDPKQEAVQALILSPTRELAQQCADEIRKLCAHMPQIKTAEVYGGADFQPQFRALKTANLVVGTPGRVMDHMRRGSLSLDAVKMVILDEADEMLNMGFKEDMETILADVPEARQVVMFSATVPDAIAQITKEFLKDPVRVNVAPEKVTLDNIEQIFVEVPMFQKPDALRLLMHYFKPHRAIIFANTKSMVDELVELLTAAGFYAQGLHGDMKQLQRTSVMQGFKKGKVNVLIATDVAARGIDVSDIDYVFNFDIPRFNEYYVHRIGRTGRAGRTGTAVTMCCGRRQVAIVGQIARATKSVITPMPLPTLADIKGRAQVRNLEKMEKALENAPSEHHVAMVAKLMEHGHSAEAIAATLLDLHFKQDFKGLTNLKVSAKGSLSSNVDDRKPREKSGKSGRTGNKYADMVIDMGSANRISPNHVIGALVERTGIHGKKLGRIEISEDYTVVGVPSERFGEILEAMGGAKICGKPIHVSPLAEQPTRRTNSRNSYKRFKKHK